MSAVKKRKYQRWQPTTVDTVVKMNRSKLLLAVKLVLELSGNKKLLRKKGKKKNKLKSKKETKKERKRRKLEEKVYIFQHYDETVKANNLNYYEATLSSIRTLTTTHRWTDSLRLVPDLMIWVFNYPLVAWKVGILVMLNSVDTTSELVNNFARKMVYITDFYRTEILLEHVGYLIENRDFIEAQRFIQENSSFETRRNTFHYIKATYSGYRAVLEYINWYNKRNALDGSQGIAGNQQMMIHLKSEVDLHLERALDFFLETTRCKGNFDLYIQTYITLLESNEEFEKVEEVLKNYVEKNEAHPSPYDYYYKFLKSRSSTDTDLQIKLLKQLVKRNPSDSRLVTLIDMMPEEEFVDRLKILLNAIDHVDCQNDLKLWKKLAIVLTNEAHNLSECHHLFVNSIWNDRKSWWPAYHFKTSNVIIESAESAELIVAKAIVIATFCNTEHEFIVAVNEELKRKVIKDDRNKLDDALEIVKNLNLRGCKNLSECAEKSENKSKKSKKKETTTKNRPRKATRKLKKNEPINNESELEEITELTKRSKRKQLTEKSKKKGNTTAKLKTKKPTGKSKKEKPEAKSKKEKPEAKSKKEKPAAKSEEKKPAAKSEKKKPAAKSKKKTKPKGKTALWEKTPKPNISDNTRGKIRKICSKPFNSSSEDEDVFNDKHKGSLAEASQVHRVSRKLGNISILSSDDDNEAQSTDGISSTIEIEDTSEIDDSSDSASFREFTSKIDEPSTSSGVKRKLASKTVKQRTKNKTPSSSNKSKHLRSDSRLLKKVGSDLVWVEKELIHMPLNDAVVVIEDNV